MAALSGCDSDENPADETPGTENRSQAGEPEPDGADLSDPAESLRNARANSYGSAPPPRRLAIRLSKVDGTRILVLIDERARMRIDLVPSGRSMLWTGDGELVCWSGAESPSKADDGQRAEFEAIRSLCDRALMRPLEDLDPSRCAVGADGRSITMGSSRIYLQEHEPSRRLLLRSFDDLEFVEFRRAGLGFIPTRLRSKPVGEVGFEVLAHDLLFDESNFRPPEPGRDDSARLVEPIRQAAVRILRRPAAELLWIPDPGDWRARFDLLTEVGGRLGRAGFRPAGEDPAVVTRDGRTYVQIAFLGPKPDHPLKLDRGEQRHQRPASRVVAVVAPDGPWARRIDMAEAALRKAVASDDPERQADGHPPELLFNHVTRAERSGPDLDLETMPVELRQGLR